MLWVGVRSSSRTRWSTGSPGSRTKRSVKRSGTSTLLAEEGVHLGEPFTRQLRGKLRELRFSLDRRRVRITYYIASGRRIVLLTVFVKTQRQERREIDRAEKAMQRCITESHTVEEDR